MVNPDNLMGFGIIMETNHWACLKDYLNCYRETHPKCEQYRSPGWGPRQSKNTI